MFSSLLVIQPHRIFSGCVLLVVAVLASAAVHADLLITPTRVVIEANQRAAQVELVNRGTSIGTYRISVVNRRMGDSGGFQTVDMTEPPLEGELFADRMVRFSPRQVTLAPGEFQTVRLMVRKPADLANGEYRSHIMFERLPETTEEVPTGSPPAPGRLAIAITARINVSIPVIVRHGVTHAEASISDMAVQAPPEGDAVLSVRINRTGTESLYGDVVVYHTAPGRSTEELARMNGLAVYVPNAHRTVQVPLSRSAAQLTGGTLRVTYSARPDDGGHLLADAEASLR